MHEGPRYSSLSDYLRVIRHHRLLIIGLTVLAGGLALLLASGKQKEYSAESAVRLRDVSADLITIQGEQVASSVGLATDATSTAALVDELPLAEAVKDRLGTVLPAERLRSAIAANVEIRTGLIVLTSTFEDPKTAAQIANGYATAIVAQRTREQRARFERALQLQVEQRAKVRRSKTLDVSARSLAELQITQTIQRLQNLVEVVKPAEVARLAEVNTRPISPKPVRDTVLGIIVGLLLGTGAAFVRDMLDRRLRGTSDVREHLGFPIVGTIGSDGLGSSAVSLNGTRPIGEEDFESVRIVAKNLTFLDVDVEPKVITVTSALPEEGKSTIASNLAMAQVLAGKRTVLLECDLRRPSLAHRLGLSATPGLSDYLSGEATPQEVLQTLTLPGVDPDGAPHQLVCVLAGSQVPRPAELLDSERMRTLLAQLREAYDTVVLDTAPVLPVVDTLSLLPPADAILLCVRSAQTTRDQATFLRQAISRLPARPTGVVVTGLNERDSSYGYYGYAYSSSAR